MFSQDTSSQVPSLAWTTKLANLQCVPEPTLHCFHTLAWNTTMGYGQRVSQDFQSTGICICTTESRVVRGWEGVCGEAGVMERTSCALGGNSYWLWLQFLPWQPGSLASCFSCAECSACSCSHCILQDSIFFFFFLLNQRAASWCCWSHPQQKARRPAHTLHNTPSLSHSILALIKTLSF